MESFCSERDFSITKRRRTENVRRERRKTRSKRFVPRRQGSRESDWGSARRRLNETRPTPRTNGRRQNARMLRRRVAIKRRKKTSCACFFAACFVKIEILAKAGCFLASFYRVGGERRLKNGNGAFEERRKDAEILRTASVNVGAARRLKRGEIGVVWGIAAFGRDRSAFFFQ